MNTLNPGDFVVTQVINPNTNTVESHLGRVVLRVANKVDVNVNGKVHTFAKEDVSQVDFGVTNAGTVWTFEPFSVAAKDWVQDNVVTADWQWLGRKLVVDHRLAHTLLQGIMDEGFVVA